MRYKSKIIQFDKYEVGIIVNALVGLRNNLIRESKTTDSVDELLLKTMNKTFKSNPTYMKLEER